MLVPEAEQGARDGHGLPARSTRRFWITSKAVISARWLLYRLSSSAGPGERRAPRDTNGPARAAAAPSQRNQKIRSQGNSCCWAKPRRHLWLHLMGALGTGDFNVRVVR